MRRLLSTAALVAVVASSALTPTAHAQVDQEEIEPTEINVGLLGIPDYDLDPENFDVATTTDTEVGWMRLELENTEFTAVLADAAAASQVSTARRIRNEAAETVKDAQLRLETKQESLGSAAIDGFLGNTEGTLNDILSPDLDVIAAESLADFTTEEIVEDRDAVRAELEAAEEVLADAEEELRSARIIEVATGDALTEAAEARAAFDVRAEEHRRIADQADRDAAALAAGNLLPEGEELPEGQEVRNSNVELRSVAGVFNVNVEIEDELDALIAHARADGIFFAGGAYRTVESQIALRLAHCGGATPPQAATSTDGEASPSRPSNLVPAQGESSGGESSGGETSGGEQPPATDPPVTEPPATDPPAADPPAGDTAPADGTAPTGGGTDGEAAEGDGTIADEAAAASAEWRRYVIYEAPASSCSPPTAIPGRSEHQTGLAVDFTENGSILTWESPGFFWLVDNASDFGLINLPSEAWHWSTTGS